MKLALISGAYPPDLDGIGDYTWWMSKTLAERDDVEKPVTVFTRMRGAHSTTVNTRIVPFFDTGAASSFRELLSSDLLPLISDLDWLVLQYNPFCFGRRGLCPWVPRTLNRIKRICPSVKIAVMFHETKVPSWPLRFTIPFVWQYPIFRAVCQQADVAFVSTRRWMPQVQRAAAGLAVHHLPVGSNIPLCNISYEDARLRSGIDRDALVVGIFGGAHVSRQLDWIAAAKKEIARCHPNRMTVLLYVGPDGTAMRLALGSVDLIDKGPLPTAEVGMHLRAMDLALSPFVDGISTRRGSVIALLQHGVPVSTTLGKWTDSLFSSDAPKSLMLSSALSREAFARETAGWQERLPASNPPYSELTSFHDKYFKWENIASSMLAQLHGAT